MNTSPVSVADRLADAPAVRETILAAASAAREKAQAKARGETLEMGHSMSHAWVITGPPGSGRSIAAMAFAAALVCTDPVETGCGRCQSCQDVFADAHTDVVHIVPTELSIGIESMQTVRKEAAKLPTISPWRIIIIEDADRLTADAANSLLKTVEEPPEHTVIMMCTPSIDPEDFSPTLRSRCRHLFIPSPSTGEIVRILTTEQSVSREDAQLAAVASLHHVGRARRLLSDPENQKRRAAILHLAELVFHRDEVFKASLVFVRGVEKQIKSQAEEKNADELATLEQSLGKGGRGKGTQKVMEGGGGAFKELAEKQKKRTTRSIRDTLDLALVDLTGIYRDAVMAQSHAQVQLTHPDFEGLSRDLAAQVTGAGLVECLDAVAQCRERINLNVTPVIAFDGMFGRIRLACGVS
ncbi:DNA polymerase III subunit delta' [Corynebacterium alimapuense]|uniref:DNA polymerase III subunit delta' n=1 Tax=Corynebacterium alimapuense TaxID=1576874 RepID=UPI001FE5EE6B|nr:DNA polymerase III subunit delta' [Corynebacterium alimapuense]